MFLVLLHHRFNNEIDTFQIYAYNFMHLSSTTFPVVLKSKNISIQVLTFDEPLNVVDKPSKAKTQHLCTS